MLLFLGHAQFIFTVDWRDAAISMALSDKGKREHLSFGQRADSWQQTPMPLAVVGRRLVYVNASPGGNHVVCPELVSERFSASAAWHANKATASKHMIVKFLYFMFYR